MNHKGSILKLVKTNEITISKNTNSNKVDLPTQESSMSHNGLNNHQSRKFGDYTSIFQRDYKNDTGFSYSNYLEKNKKNLNDMVFSPEYYPENISQCSSVIKDSNKTVTNSSNSSVYQRYYNSYYTINSQTKLVSKLKRNNNSPSNSQKSPTVLTLSKSTSNNKKTLVLDLDETLVHASFQPFPFKCDFTVSITVNNKKQTVYVLKRPFVDEFLQEMAKHYELVLFTASIPQYANPLLNYLDPEHLITKRLFRENCINSHGMFIKDLKQLGRDMKQTFILDNNPASYLLNQDNGVPIRTWHSDKQDKELVKMIPFLEYLTKIPDVRESIKSVKKGTTVDYDVIDKIISTPKVDEKRDMQANIGLDNNTQPNQKPSMDNNSSSKNNIYTNYIHQNEENNNKGSTYLNYNSFLKRKNNSNILTKTNKLISSPRSLSYVKPLIQTKVSQSNDNCNQANNHKSRNEIIQDKSNISNKTVRENATNDNYCNNCFKSTTIKINRSYNILEPNTDVKVKDKPLFYYSKYIMNKTDNDSTEENNSEQYDIYKRNQYGTENSYKSKYDFKSQRLLPDNSYDRTYTNLLSNYQRFASKDNYLLQTKNYSQNSYNISKSNYLTASQLCDLTQDTNIRKCTLNDQIVNKDNIRDYTKLRNSSPTRSKPNTNKYPVSSISNVPLIKENKNYSLSYNRYEDTKQSNHRSLNNNSLTNQSINNRYSRNAQLTNGDSWNRLRQNIYNF